MDSSVTRAPGAAPWGCREPGRVSGRNVKSAALESVFDPLKPYAREYCCKMSAGNATVGSRPDPSAAGGDAARRAFRLSFAGLLTAMAVASLDQNIVSTALPRIVGELGGLAHLPWVITAFMLTATATAPLYGKLSDMHGRRPLFVVSIVVFIAGSTLCGLARSMTG